MANFKDQVDQVKLLHELTRQKMKDEKFIDSTLEDRADTLNDIIKAGKDTQKLTEIQEDLEAKIAGHIETGHTELAKKYEIEKKLADLKKEQVEAEENINDALTEAGDELLGGMVTKANDLY